MWWLEHCSSVYRDAKPTGLTGRVNAQEQLGNCSSKPLIGHIMLVSLMPELFDLKTRRRYRQAG